MTARITWVVAAAAALAWAPFVTAPLSPDEGGFLLVSSQWRPGHSLYGPYWVDRPPLLITIFDVASDVGGAVALRLIGITAVLTSVFLAHLLTRRATGRPSAVPVLVAGVFLTTPLFGTGMVNGELLAVPVVLVGILALVRSWTATRRRAYGWAILAGTAAAAAPLVKQNVVDVLVVAAVLVGQGVRSRSWRRTVTLVVGMAVGTAATTLLLLVWAEVHGTEPMMLWDALVTFREQAAAVIDSSSTSSTSGRFTALVGAALLSGAPLVVAVLSLRLRRAPAEPAAPDLRAAALVLLFWELVAIAAGGSYWLHYLIGLVPGLVLLAVAAEQRPPRLRRQTAGVLVARVSVGGGRHRRRCGQRPVVHGRRNGCGVPAVPRLTQGHGRGRLRPPGHRVGLRSAQPLPLPVEPAGPGARPRAGSAQPRHVGVSCSDLGRGGRIVARHLGGRRHLGPDSAGRALSAGHNPRQLRRLEAQAPHSPCRVSFSS